MADVITMSMSNGDAEVHVKDIKREWLEEGFPSLDTVLLLLDDAMDELYKQHPERKRP